MMMGARLIVKINQYDILEQAFWRQHQRPLGPCCEWPRSDKAIERWPETAPNLPKRELWCEAVNESSLMSFGPS